MFAAEQSFRQPQRTLAGGPTTRRCLIARANENYVATEALRNLRRTYRTAYTLYMHSVQDLADASQRGTWLSKEVEADEKKALDHLTFSRQALLDELYAYSKNGDSK